MVNMIIDGKHVSAEENITIMEAAERNGIPIPKLCYLKGINEIAACRVCVVELEGKERKHSLPLPTGSWKRTGTIREKSTLPLILVKIS